MANLRSCSRILLNVVLCQFVLIGCAPQPISLEQQALDSCLWSDEQSGWQLDAAKPENAEMLLRLVRAKSTSNAVQDDSYPQYWFTHISGRRFACSTYSFLDLPAVCTRIAYEFVQNGDDWYVEETNLVICYQ